jgi:hypothetical protein
MTKGYGGRQILKRITVQTNDVKHASLQLVVKGKVKKFVTIQPKRVRLNGALQDVVRQTVEIIPEKAYPFKIVGTSAKPGDNIKLTLGEKEGEGGKSYQIVIENIRQQAGRYYETITIKTDSDVKPELEIRVYGDIKDPEGKTPPASDSSSAIDKPAGGKTMVKAAPPKKDPAGGVKIKISKGEAKTE